jgi:hypothetical protein
LTGGVAAWPLATRAQQLNRVQRIGVPMGNAESDDEGQSGVAAFREELRKAGWTEHRNIEIDTRWAAALTPEKLFDRLQAPLEVKLIRAGMSGQTKHQKPPERKTPGRKPAHWAPDEDHACLRTHNLSRPSRWFVQPNLR